MSISFLNTTTFVVISCYKCHMQFAVSKEANDEWLNRREQVSFFCPNGHSQLYIGKTEAQKLKDELTRERARLDQVRADNDRLRSRITVKDHQLRARKGIATKLRNRIANGVCPCCTKTFKDLKSHMRQHHPDWNLEKAAEALAAKSES